MGGERADLGRGLSKKGAEIGGGKEKELKTGYRELKTAYQPPFLKKGG